MILSIIGAFFSFFSCFNLAKSTCSSHANTHTGVYEIERASVAIERYIASLFEYHEMLT